MKSRSNPSSAKLDYYQQMIQNVIMIHQDPVTGLLPATPDNNHAWIRDNVYCIMAVWGLSMAYNKIADADEDRAITYELKQSCVKLMRGLLMSMMHQKDKVEKFKATQNPCDSIHAKFSSSTGKVVVKDHEWGHLQIDAISLYLLVLAQMTASGLQIVFNLDEVAFIQNLIFYIESAYCTPDYGIWERGDKANHGLPELNASSVGMAKAALESMNELDLFGARGGSSSIIHVLADEAHKCHAVLQTMLPRESNSKEVDSGLLAIISFPAFAVDDADLIQTTRNAIIQKLQGKYGCKRFLRDGYKTPKEDPNRLYYEPSELRIFEHIECEWPLFFCYFILDACFQGDTDSALEYSKMLENVLVPLEDSDFQLVPELYAVESGDVDAEYANPSSQKRIPIGRCPFLWAQSLFILGKLLQENFLAVGELDPLNRRLCSEEKLDVLVQVVVLAEDEAIKEKLLKHGIHLQTVEEVSPIEIQPARVLGHLFTYLGRNKKLGLTGRKSRDVGILSTSKLYSLNDKIIAFTPQKTDLTHFYIALDHELMIDIFKSEISFLKSSWQNMLGRPLVVLNIKNIHLDKGEVPIEVIKTIKKLESGYINGTRVIYGNINDFLKTSNITNLSFLGCQEEGFPDRLDPEVEKYLEDNLGKKITKTSINQNSKSVSKGNSFVKRRMSVRGAIKKTRSITIEPDFLGMQTEECPVVQKPSLLENTAPVTDEKENDSLSSDEAESDRKTSSRSGHLRLRAKTNLAAKEVEELMAILKETENLEEEGDVLQYLVDTLGLQYDTGLIEDGKSATVRDLLKSLYVKACEQKLWGVVRHTAGIIGKRAEDLAKSVTDLIVRQKQITIGMPPNNEQTITRPIPDQELRQVIHQAYGDDQSSSMLTQELIVYLAMFIRTEPQLFKHMLRIRVGLIIQVMATELSWRLGCSGDEASELLLNFSPCEMKNFLQHILSGEDFDLTRVDKRNYSILQSIKKSQIELTSVMEKDSEVKCSEDRQGMWLRRRRLDGALNRFPCDLYPSIWSLLEKCEGLAIECRLLPQNLTQEMTSGELKFALTIETALNSIPQPEYRQLMVEALMILISIHEGGICLKGIIAVDQLVHKANAIFLEDQAKCDGDATLCCAVSGNGSEAGRAVPCGGAAYICQHFYDTAPCGMHGTSTYLIRAAAKMFNFPINENFFLCSII